MLKYDKIMIKNDKMVKYTLLFSGASSSQTSKDRYSSTSEDYTSSRGTSMINLLEFINNNNIPCYVSHYLSLFLIRFG